MKTTRIPVNTERLAAEQPDMLSWVMGGAPHKIEEQEAQGQQSFVKSETLPTNMGRWCDYNTKTILETAGVKFVCEVPDDPMFQIVELPTGWRKIPTDHSMWSKLVDDKSRVRARIFYKAAFYDRSANLSLSCRYQVSFDYGRSEKEGVGVTNITDGGKVIFSTEPIPVNREKSWRTSEQTNKLAVEWLDKNYPDWKNPGAYWD
ncbi:MAG: hypothetical protein A2431_00455 [Candidatus Zambryskibacteria bacterium RIFOXYC1_FULL_39_10]|uniref:Uncharacterized protein n=1 Tax=Candidatus Zambryskibacteria bacterium RIFOXYC1_FULL_39_10 TaxID=1802779 RepID=A0A1G2UZ78_9BACT|nr:MAG: hypothetical protein A2431_00455 [Candidatus Zambryskibacteria bacterium RIFOXYC1_FULL_39_10]OHB15616.1 MAG: hypothetical protein A2605_02315 [Candidatus Zambryskibacteria bacterium RIFOXYD1_FULL_39_35]